MCNNSKIIHSASNCRKYVIKTKLSVIIVLIVKQIYSSAVYFSKLKQKCANVVLTFLSHVDSILSHN